MMNVAAVYSSAEILNASGVEQQHAMVCRICRFPGSDVRVMPCGCNMHARCVPLTTIVAASSLEQGGRDPVARNTVACPACQSSLISGLYLMPMSMKLLDEAVRLRKKSARDKVLGGMGGDGGANSGPTGATTKSRGDGQQDESFLECQAESSYLLLSHGNASTALSTDTEYQRTGRWTEEEIRYVDFLLDAFDNSKLPAEHGMKLNDFLSEMLLCKSSRLTKKLKNARLSIRSYEFKYPAPLLDVELMSTLEEKLLSSITSEPSRLELRFNMTKLWRSRLSNLCLQVGSSLLDANDWIASLEDMERRAAEAEENIRKARRKRMGLALKTDSRTAHQNGVFFAGVPVQRPPKKYRTNESTAVAATQQPYPSSVTSSSTVGGGATLPRVTSLTDASSIHSNSSDGDGSDGDHFISNMLDLGSQQSLNQQGVAVGTLDMDYSSILDDLIRGPGIPPQTSRHIRNNCGPFLEEISSFMEMADLPFQHVDVWVPTCGSTSQQQQNTQAPNGEIRLCHAGHATRNDLDASLFCQLSEYGEYSVKFSFPSGVGLPGRVFASGNASWERDLDEADPQWFERAGGCKVYGVKTGFGFPLSTSVIGRIVVVLYSIVDLEEDKNMISKCVSTLSKLSPEPKWKLVVEMGDGENGASASSSQAVSKPIGGLIHYQHSSVGKEKTPPVLLPSGGTSAADQKIPFQVNNPAFGGSMLGDINAGVVTKSLDVEQRMATLLGEHMPAPGAPSAAEAASAFIPHFMSLRLLLLRAPNRRTVEENDMLDVIKSSFEGYAKDSRRSEKELTFLVVNDWQYLKASFPAPQVEPKKMAAAPAAPAATAPQHVSLPPGSTQTLPAAGSYSQLMALAANTNDDNQLHQQQKSQAPPPAPQQQSQQQHHHHHQSHVMNAPAVTTLSPVGGPVTMPKALTYMDPRHVVRRSSSVGGNSLASYHHDASSTGGTGHQERRNSDDMESSSTGSPVTGVPPPVAPTSGNVHVVENS